MTWGQFFRKGLRELERAGYTRKAVARKLSCDQSLINHMLRGHVPKRDLTHKIGELFGDPIAASLMAGYVPRGIRPLELCELVRAIERKKETNTSESASEGS